MGAGVLAAAAGAAFSSVASSLATSAGILVSPAFSTENLEITCGLPLSKSWKSSLRSVPTAFPLESRTTTGTITRFTLVLKVAGASREVISAVFGDGVWASAAITPNDNSTAIAFPLLRCPPECATVAIINMPRAFFLVTILSIMIGAPLAAQPSPEQVDRFFDDVYFKFNPTTGTSSGFHQYDTLLEDYSKAGVDTQVRALQSAEKQFSALPEDPDRDLILNYIRATLLSLEQVRPWEKNPDSYSSGVTVSIFVIMSRTFAPPADRLQSVIARERQIPAVFEAARANLKNPPQIYTRSGRA